MQKVNWKTKAALIFSIVAFGAAICNFFIGSEKVRIIIWTIVIICWALNFLVLLENNDRCFKERNKAILKKQFWQNAVAAIENEVRFNVNLSDEAREQLLEKIAEEVEDIKANCKMFEIE